MKIYHGIEDFKKLDFAVVTSGTFDGVHAGHQKILSRLKEIARQHGGETVLITYWPHPRFILNPDDNSLKLLSTFEEKAQILSQHGVDHLIRIPFTSEFSQMSSEDFIRKVLIDKIGTKILVIGYDHRFGKNREGSFEHLQENAGKYGFEVEEIPRLDVEHIGVSSTKIRKALEEGNVCLANEFLCREYCLMGKVISGKKLGRTIGFPTANIAVKEQYKLIPSDGTYAVKILCREKFYKGMLNIGLRPTVDGHHKAIEVNIFDFNEDIYDEQLTIFFVQKIRDEIKFSGIEALQAQLVQDKKQVLKILS
jgi:riboflavin kinase / FMN adenylyltransferase